MEVIGLQKNSKKSFVLYFDMLPGISALPPAQRGELLSALFVYAEAEAEGPAEQAAVLAQYPDMAPETRMAFQFIAETIRRDTEKWREKHERYVNAARARAEKERAGRNDDIWKYCG